MSTLVGNKLIDVNFIDETNYTTPTSDADIVSVIVDTNWGPCERPVVCDSSSYRELFNPSGLGRLNGTMATVQRSFDAGAAYMEVLRLGSKETWKFFKVSLMAAGGEATEGVSLSKVEKPYSANPVLSDFASVGLEPTATQAVFRLRYPGGFPMFVTVSPSSRPKFMGKSLYDIKVEAYTGVRTVSNKDAVSGETYIPFVTADDQAFVLKDDLSFDVRGEAGDEQFTYTTLETLQVSFSPLEANGQSFFYADVINSKSAYLTASPVEAHAAFLNLRNSETGSTGDYVLNGQSSGIGVALAETYLKFEEKYVASDWVLAYDNFMRSRDVSRATLLVNSFIPVSMSDVEGYRSILSKMSTHAEGRKDCNAVLGFPTFVDEANYWGSGVGVSTDRTTASNAVKWFNAVSSDGSYMFADGIVGWELYTLSTICGRLSFNMDCTAAWAGRICAVAQAERNRNQLPSYKAFGMFSGALVRSLSFDAVVDLHDNYGIGSVYRTSLGNFIFCIRGLYGATESYFARMNVMRVCAALLGNVFDVVEQVIHTDACANRNSRLRLESKLNTLIGTMQSRKELRPESYADVGDTLNTDTLTNGGRYLNIRLNLWFMSLVERVNITVVATDSSVDATISMG